jgi:large subunit ribosomal protein L1
MSAAGNHAQFLQTNFEKVMAKKQDRSGEEKGQGEMKTAAAKEEKKKEPAAKKEPRKPKEPKEAKDKTTPLAPVSEASAVPQSALVPSGQASVDLKKRRKQPGNPPPLGKRLKNRLRQLKEKLASEEPASLKRAVAILKQNKRAKFDETLEVHMNLGVDTTQNEQMVRGSVPLPYGIGKPVRVLVFCQGDNVAKAKEAGADHSGSTDLIKKIQDGWLDFDVALATQDMMGQVSRLGKVLGPRGLMPTPKAGTVVTAGGDVATAVREFKAGKVEYRVDKGGNVHAGVGKLSFDDEKLEANIGAFVDQVKAAKPAGVKGNYIKSVSISATMSPSIRVSI